MKDSTQITILTFCIVITLILSISIYIRGHDNSCDKCEIDFTLTQYSGISLDNPIVKQVKVIDMYNGILNNKCIIKWDRSQGYYE